jgi:hypothetical protein
MVIPIDCPICRDAGMIDFHPFTIMLPIRWKRWSNFDVFASFLNRSSDLSLCFCYLYCSKMVYSILFSWFTIMRYKPSCLLVCPIVFQLLPVLSLTAYWVLLDFHHEVTLSCSIDIGVIFKPCDCIASSYVYAFYIGHLGSNIFQAVTLIAIG